VLEIKHSDGTFESFAYRKDGELMEASNANSTVRLKRNLLGQVTQEQQGDVMVESQYDSLGLRSSVRSSLGAAFEYGRNAMGDVSQVSAGDYQVRFQRDALGLELEREFSGGLRSRWYRNRLGRPEKQETVTGGGFRQRIRTYKWQVNARLQQIDDTQHGVTRFSHDDLGNLAWTEHPDGSMLFRMPDAVGNLFRTKDRTDRKYGRAGQLLQSGRTRYKYDAEGNLIRKIEEGGKEWHYSWNAAGMLSRVTRPDGEAVTFTYDGLGRRLSKTFRGKTTRWVWDGNIPLHEWSERANIKASVKQLALASDANGGHQAEELVTWLFEPGSFAPLAKLTKEASYDIVSDHLGTPLSMHKASGDIAWSADLNGYGEVINLRGKAEDCPFRYPGQYEDVETGLYYNRFRYYDPKEGIYVSQDPIGLLRNNSTLYSYVRELNAKIDPLGLSECGKKERFYRTMSQEHYLELVKTGRLPATRETCISPTRTFSEEGYLGVTVEFELKPGTIAALEGIGVKDRSNFAKGKYENMPVVTKGWTENNAFFKTEKVHSTGIRQTNIGLGQGKALSIFNENIISFIKAS
jgi:RHS repeat-associated protein